METTQPKSIRLQLESLKGGYISDISGERTIYKDSYEILECLDLETIINRLEPNQYHLNIDIIPKSEYDDYVDLLALHKKVEEPVMTYEEAKASGLIQVEKFNPNPVVEPKPIEKEIKVTAETAYKAGKLKQIDWKMFDEELPLTNAEKMEISGMSSQAMYNQFRKAKAGTASFHLSETRIGMTILAKYYEANLGIRTSQKDTIDLLKKQVLDTIREVELLTSNNKFVKSSAIIAKLADLRKNFI